MEPSIVRILWQDSGTYDSGGWSSKEEIVSRTSITDVYTVGYLLQDEGDVVYVATSFDPDHEHYFGVQAILKQNIIFSMTVLDNLMKYERKDDGKDRRDVQEPEDRSNSKGIQEFGTVNTLPCIHCGSHSHYGDNCIFRTFM